MSLVSQETLRQYIDADLNVLFTGERGVGKTAMAFEAFRRAKINVKYFSAATLDPWVDLIGTPQKKVEGELTFIELVRPEFLVKEKVEAVFFDELNRAPDKVLNAVMEMIQFKSINGFPLPNLRMVWAAINPETEDHQYSVNHLDPAHLDRFHVHIEVPYELDEAYFKKTFPAEVATRLMAWWNAIPVDIRKQVSPRRLEYAGHAAMKGMKLEHFLPLASNPTKLRTELRDAPYWAKLAEAMKTPDAAKKFITDSNMVSALSDKVLNGDKNSIDFWKQNRDALPGELVQATEKRASVKFASGVNPLATPRTTAPAGASTSIPMGEGHQKAIAKLTDITNDVHLSRVLRSVNDSLTQSMRMQAYEYLNQHYMKQSDADLFKHLSASVKVSTASKAVMEDLKKLLETGRFSTMTKLLFDSNLPGQMTLTYRLVSMIAAVLNVDSSEQGTILDRLQQGKVLTYGQRAGFFYKQP